MSPGIGEDDAKAIVRRGYDEIVERFEAWATTVHGRRGEYELRFLELVPDGGRILELGCGSMRTSARTISHGFEVIGVDVSARSLSLAQQAAPSTKFICADMTHVDFPEDSFDGVAAFYSIIHVPRDEQPALFRSIARWLRPGGALIATLSVFEDPGTVEPDWHGVPMYWSGYSRKRNIELLQDAGFEILVDEVVTQEEHGLPVSFLWIVARRHH